MLLSSERPFVGASAFCIPGATLLCRNGLTQAVLPESDWNMANGYPRFPRNLGERCSLLGESRLEIPGHQLQALAVHSSVRERKQRVKPRYRQAKETKRGGMAAGRHSVLIIPKKLANFTPLEPVEGSETSFHGTVTEKHDECIEIRQPCPRNRNG
jgi:hypothetical protein